MTETLDGDVLAEAMITVQDAAKLLGVHPNTVRNRIKSGQYQASWVPSSHGPRQLIPRSSLESDHSQSNGVAHNNMGPSIQLAELRHSQEEAVQRVLSPFLDRLEATLRENGRLQEANRVLEGEVERLRERLEAPQSPRKSWWERVFGGGGEG